jgi:hypothetical protein
MATAACSCCFLVGADCVVQCWAEEVALSLRMNLDGWRLSFTQALGSKDSALLEAATARLSKAFPKRGKKGVGALSRQVISSNFLLQLPAPT